MGGYKRERPNVVVEYIESTNLGNCYNAFAYKVTSNRRLTHDQMIGLRDLGFMCSGQEFSVNSQCDGKEEPTGFDTTQYTEESVDEDGNITVSVYTGESFKPIREPYWVYFVASKIDSGG